MPTMMFKVTVTHETGTVATLFLTTEAKVEELRDKIQQDRNNPNAIIYYTNQLEHGSIYPNKVVDFQVEEVDVETELTETKSK